jgi:tetratricopeptide (TPR) repeat protein
LSLLLFLLLSPILSFGQQTVGKETLAIDYFNQGNYEKALPIFAKLAQSYPDNAMYNYYYGVSLIKNSIFEMAAKEALLNSVVDKTPSNSNFYLANYFHALGEWQEAKDFYDRYAKVGSKSEKKSLRFDYYVDLCEKKTNPFTPKKSTDTALFGENELKPPPKIDEKNYPIPEGLKTAWFNFQVNEFLAYHSITDFKSEASKILFTKAWICTGKNDSILALTDSLRLAHENIARVDTRLGIVQQIVDCEQKSYQIMKEREKFLEQSRAKESAYWEREGKATALAYNASIQERENKIAETSKQAEASKEAVVPPVAMRDTLPVNLPSPPETNLKEEEKPIQENLVYKVRIGAFKNGVLTPAFRSAYAKVSKLRKIEKYTDEKKQVVYTVGNFTNPADAAKMKDQLIREGMKGATVATYDKTTGKPYKAPVPAPASKTVQQEEMPTPVTTEVKQAPTAGAENLVFKVQIGSVKNDLQSTAFRKAKARISKTTQVDSYKDSRNYVVYTVGNLASYQEATKLKDQMVKEGFKDAYVAAFLQGTRIKMSEALKLSKGD